MIFSTIEDDAKLSGQRITSAFDGIITSIKKTVKSTSGITFDIEFNKALKKDTQALSNYISELKKKNVTMEQAFANTMREASPEVQKYAQTTNTKNLDPNKFAEQQKQWQVSLLAQENSFKNIKTLLNEYNSSLNENSNGVTKCGIEQTNFVNAVGKSNSVLGKYLTGLNGTNATMKGYIGKLVASKIATIGLEIATTALNAAITMGISALVQLGIEGISHLINYYDELDQKVKDVTATYKEQKTSLTDTSKELETLKSNYTKFSPHIDSANQNIDLPVEEYQEYLDTCNKLGEMFPTLVQGYDSQGNAILKCKGNVEELTKK